MARPFRVLSRAFLDSDLPEPKVTLTPIPGGDAGTKATLKRMKEIVWESLRHPKHSPIIRMAAAKAILDAGCKPKDYLCEFDSMHRFVRDRIRWTKDARRHETLQWPARTLQLGIGDAFRKDTKIILRRRFDGTYRVVELGHLEKTASEYDALSFNYETKEFEFKPIIAWYDKGVKPTFKIRTKNGRDLYVSDGHLMDFFPPALGRNRGSVLKKARANEIFERFTNRRAPRLPFALKIPELGTVNHLTSEQMFLDGMYLSEGWAETGECDTVRIANKDVDLFARVCAAAEKLGIRYHVTICKKTGVQIFCTSDRKFIDHVLTNYGKSSFEKTIPDDYLSISRERMTELIEGYTLGDAYKPKESHAWSKYANLIHNTASYELARKLCLMHMIMGRPLHLQENHMGAGQSPVWRLIERKNVRGYEPLIGDVTAAPIQKFESIGEAECCDVTVLDNHNVVTEQGIVMSQCDDKCLSPDTLQWVRINGHIKRLTIKELVKYFVPSMVTAMVGGQEIFGQDEEIFIQGDDQVEVLSFSGKSYRDGFPIWTRVSRMYRKKAATKLLKITVAGGRSITCTPNHKLFSSDGKTMWEVRAGDLQVGDRVLLLRELPSCGKDQAGFSEKDLFAYGFWLSSGCYEQDGPKFSCGLSDHLIDFVHDWASSIDADASISRSGKGDVLVCSRALMARMKELGLSGSAHSKAIPSWAFELSDKQLARFLFGYFSGAGSIRVDRDGTHICVLSVNKTMLEDVRDLLNRLGIDGVIAEAVDWQKSNEDKLSVVHRLGIHSSFMVKRFIERIGNFRDVVITKPLPARSGYPAVSRTIRSIEEIEGNEVYDLEVEEERHRFVANGFITHNSMLLAAMMLHVGFPGVAFKAIGANAAAPDQFTHVYIIGDPFGKGKWIASDPTVSGAKLGWESPIRYRELVLEL